MPWIVKEYEGSTHRLIDMKSFQTKEAALDHYIHCKSLNLIAGVGGCWNHYWSYPKMVREDPKAAINPYSKQGVGKALNRRS